MRRGWREREEERGKRRKGGMEEDIENTMSCRQLVCNDKEKGNMMNEETDKIFSGMLNR